jgi:CubicO group peptidase (beta-lactamase class C family)
MLIRSGAFAQSGIPVPELSPIDDDVREFLEKWQIPGATVALAQDEKLLYSRGFGQADENQTMQPDQLFRIASLSKPITAMAVMKLVQDGLLHLDDHAFGATGILNSDLYANIADPRIKEITIQHLLQHTAGWNRDTNPEGDPMFNSVNIAMAMKVAAPADPVSIIRYILAKPLDFAPGTRFSYSNLGYNILGRIIEQVSGMTYENYVKTAIFQPLGISEMALGRNLFENKKPQEVRYFNLEERKVKSVYDDGKKVSFPYGGFNLEAMDAHGGWLASAPDLIKILISLDGNDLNSPLNKEHIALMTTPSTAKNNYSLGWFVNAQGNWWHTGTLIGSATLMAHLQDGKKWVLLLNARPDKDAFYSDLDQLMWKATQKITTWPTKDINQLTAQGKMRKQKKCNKLR